MTFRSKTYAHEVAQEARNAEEVALDAKQFAGMIDDLIELAPLYLDDFEHEGQKSDREWVRGFLSDGSDHCKAIHAAVFPEPTS